MTLGREDCEKRDSKSYQQESRMTAQTLAIGPTLEAVIDLPSLPEVVLLRVLDFCEVVTLGRIAQVNKFFMNLVDQNRVWRSTYRGTVFYGISSLSKCDCKRFNNGLLCAAHHNNCACALSLKDRVHMSRNWVRGDYGEYKLLKAVRQMPSVHLENGFLYRTDRNTIFRYKQKCNGQIQTSPVLSYRGMVDDVCGFLSKQGRIIAGSVDGRIMTWNQNTGDLVSAWQTGHTATMTCVRTVEDLIVTGSKDQSVGIWNVHGRDLRCRHKLLMQDRVWSLALDPGVCQLVTGTAGLNQVPALRLWDLGRGCLISALADSDEQRNGAGVLDVQYCSNNALLSCGYDTNVRLWDVRTKKCVMKWEDPFDVTVYCIRAQGPYSLISGTALYGMARLWDQRSTKPVQQYYVSKTTSPVYSLAYDPSYLYLALDKGIHLLDFTIK